MRPAFELVTAPASEPLSQATAKAHCRVTSAAEDDLFDRLIVAARRHIESTYGLALIDQTHKATLDAWPVRGLELTPYPVSALSSVKVWNGTTLVTQTASLYQLLPGRPGRVVLADNATPAVPGRTRAGIVVEFVAGFGADDTDTPEDVTQALLMLIAHWYENRETVIIGAKETKVSSEVSRGVSDLLFPYRGFRL